MSALLSAMSVLTARPHAARLARLILSPAADAGQLDGPLMIMLMWRLRSQRGSPRRVADLKRSIRIDICGSVATSGLRGRVANVCKAVGRDADRGGFCISSI